MKPFPIIFGECKSGVTLCIYMTCQFDFQLYIYMAKRLHDDSANDNSAIDKMAARFWHTDDSATFFWKKKANFFSYPSRVSLKDFSYPSRVPETT